MRRSRETAENTTQQKNGRSPKDNGQPQLMEPIRLPIEDVLDLHTFHPREVPDLLNDYFSECLAVGKTSVRLIHGKGRGILKKRVHSLLKKNPMVEGFKDAPPEAGGWGATLVELKMKSATRL